MNKNINNIYKYLLALIGLTLVLYYIWFRFIRERLARDIPFENSYLTFIILTIICLTYIYVILRLLKPKTPNKFILSLIIKMQKIYKPFIVLDEILQNNFIFCFLMDYFLVFLGALIEKSNYYIFSMKNKNILYFIILTIPKIILLVTFCIDIFYFHKIKYLYNIIWIGFIPLFMKYILYIIKTHLEKKIQYLDDNYYTISTLKEGETDDKLYNYMIFPSSIKRNICGFINTKYFIELQASSVTVSCDLYNYDCVETIEAREKFAKKFNINLPPIYVGEPRNDAISIELSKEYFKWMPIVINISAFFEELDTYKEETKKIQDQTIIITLVLYVICWLYILFITLCTLNQESWINILEALKEILKNMEEPFSLIKINEINTNYEQQNKQN